MVQDEKVKSMRHTFIVLLLLVFSLSMVSAATVTGKVVGPDGKPIKGANLLLYLYGGRNPQELLSDAGGNFSAEVDLSRRGMSNSLGQIFAYAPGYALTSAMLVEGGNVITLNAGTTISGTVVNAAGKPLAGIPVMLRALQHNADRTIVPVEWLARFTATSGAGGGWTLPGIPPEGTAWLVLDDGRYVPEQQNITLVAGEKATAVRFTVRPGAILTGRVLKSQDTPAMDALVEVRSNFSSDHMATHRSGRTGADGRYRFSRLPAGTYTISAKSEKQAWVAEPLKAITLVEGKETTAPDLHADAGAVLEGTVVDAETGTPIPNVFFRLRNKQIRYFSESPFLCSDKSGHFRVHTQAAQTTLFIENRPPGYLTQLESAVLTVDLREGKTVTVTVKLHKGLSVTGTITDMNGNPVAGMNAYISAPASQDVAGRSWNRPVFLLPINAAISRLPVCPRAKAPSISAP